MSCFVDIYDSPYFKKGTREMNTIYVAMQQSYFFMGKEAPGQPSTQ